jgi:arsenate reductase (glutaredoxin)
MGGKFDARTPAAAAVIWHNPRCSKSRQTLELLRARGIEPVVRNYLDDAPSAGELEEVIGMLGGDPRALLRSKEKGFAELDLGRADITSEELVSAMAENPILIERPVVIRGQRAALGRPPENVTALFES